MKKKWNYDDTIRSCMASYIVQAVVNSFVPLLFVQFQEEFGLSLLQVTFLITFNFGLQLVIDLASAFFIDVIGYRKAVVLAHITASLGLICLTFLPDLLGYAGILMSVLIYAVGGGLIEVIISPITDACPSEHKEAVMSALHSFYCWGVVGVVLLSTLFFHFFGIGHWRILSVLWSVFPLANMIMFFLVPIPSIVPEGKEKMGKRHLLAHPVFWLLFFMMVASGASEQAVSQWASTFAEKGLSISKTMGDLLGPMLFSVLMGTSRSIFGKFGMKLDLKKFMLISGVLCVLGYLLIIFAPVPALALAGCGVCGFAVGIFWPGTTSLASASFQTGGTALFSFLALAGDIGCSLGPTISGAVSSAAGSMQAGFAAVLIFPLLMIGGTILLAKRKN
jgi:MFS family permease